MKKINLLGSLVALLLTFGCNAENKNIDTSTISELNVERYMGTWYEIARFDHKFERGLVGNTALYMLEDDGTIKVFNAGYQETLDGKYQRSIGKARMPDKEKPGELEVSFFWNFYSPYKILHLDENYKYALIGSNSPKYLWILSRTPQLPEDILQMLLDEAKARGYDIENLIFVEQPEY